MRDVLLTEAVIASLIRRPYSSERLFVGWGWESRFIFGLIRFLDEVRGVKNILLQACSAFYVVRSASAKFGLHAGNMKFHTQNELAS